MHADISQIYAGVISDNDEQKHIIRNALLAVGIKVSFSSSPGALQEKMFGSNMIQLWIIDLVMQDRWDNFIDRIIEESPATLMFGDGNAPATSSGKYPRWQKRLLTKISKLLEIGVVKAPVPLNTQLKKKTEITNKPFSSSFANATPPTIPFSSKGPKTHIATEKRSGSYSAAKNKAAVQVDNLATRVWVLGASLGGPSAVKTFLDSLEPNLPVAFILVQHMDLGYQALLGDVLVRHNNFNIRKKFDGKQLKCGDILIAPADYSINIELTACITKTTKPWKGSYSPCINQVMESVGKQYGMMGGAIIFSGMGDDGSDAAKYFNSLGGVILAQSQETCTNISLSDSIRQTGYVSFNGSPKQLAAQFMLELEF